MFAAVACVVANAICSRTMGVTPALVACLERIGSTAGVPQPQWAYVSAVSTWGIGVLVLVVILGIVGVIADRWPYTLVNYGLLLVAATYFGLAFVACRSIGESAESCQQKLSPAAILLFNGDGTSPDDGECSQRRARRVERSRDLRESILCRELSLQWTRRRQRVRGDADRRSTEPNPVATLLTHVRHRHCG